jgi:Cys-tRNA(Pro)/Cys-tRNA(Cys) deacylase
VAILPEISEQHGSRGVGTQRVLQDAADRGIPIELVKSLVVKRHDGRFLFALVGGDRQISWSQLRAVVGVNKLTLPTAELPATVADITVEAEVN